MPLDQLILFITLTFFLSASPGPVMLSCMTNGGHYGVGKALYGMLGASVGNLLLMLISAVGLGLLLSEAEFLFVLIKWLGAAYLIYLGVRIIVKPVDAQMDSGTPFTSSARRLFFQSIVIACSNPKGLVYFGALFPQFITSEKPLAPQFVLLSIIFLAMDLVWMLIYARGGSYIVRWLKTPRHHRIFNLLSGGSLMTVGVLLAFT